MMRMLIDLSDLKVKGHNVILKHCHWDTNHSLVVLTPIFVMKRLHGTPVLPNKR